MCWQRWRIQVCYRTWCLVCAKVHRVVLSNNITGLYVTQKPDPFFHVGLCSSLDGVWSFSVTKVLWLTFLEAHPTSTHVAYSYSTGLKHTATSSWFKWDKWHLNFKAFSEVPEFKKPHESQFLYFENFCPSCWVSLIFDTRIAVLMCWGLSSRNGLMSFFLTVGLHQLSSVQFVGSVTSQLQTQRHKLSSVLRTGWWPKYWPSWTAPLQNLWEQLL